MVYKGYPNSTVSVFTLLGYRPFIDYESTAERDGTLSVLWFSADDVPSINMVRELEVAAIATLKRKQINVERDRREQGGFSYAGKIIDSDPISCQRITVAGATAQLAIANNVQDYSITWICADNSALILDAVGVLGMVQALGVHGLHVHAAAKSHKDAVAALDTLDAVLAYDYSTGWPE